jgi:leucyl/phenylalanyl-tRNA--protein transferase
MTQPMPLWMLDEEIWFPPASQSLPDGLLAIGGDLRPERLLLGYRSGIFPWYNEDDPILWWSPDPRFVLYPEKLKVSHSMRQILKAGKFEYRFDTAFEAVIRGCATTPRPGGGGTWINEDMVAAYMQLHAQGYAHSAEAWLDGELAGGLYGVRLGGVFFGESMFSRVSNASKVAFTHLVRTLQADGLRLIDCQMHTAHLESLGAEGIAREEFLAALKEWIR